MSIQIEVPFDALSRPGVASALADLMVSLGGHSDLVGAAEAPAAPAAKAAAKPVAAKPAAPKPAAPKPRAKAKSKGKAKSKPKSKGRKAKAAPAPAPSPDAPYAERWSAYVANLPAASARFLELLESKGELTVSEAVKTLGLKTPKAMGGLTGAMRRWAPKQHISLPFEARKTTDNERCWVWTGHPE